MSAACCRENAIVAAPEVKKSKDLKTPDLLVDTLNLAHTKEPVQEDPAGDRMELPPTHTPEERTSCDSGYSLPAQVL